MHGHISVPGESSALPFSLPLGTHVPPAISLTSRLLEAEWWWPWAPEALWDKFVEYLHSLPLTVTRGDRRADKASEALGDRGRGVGRNGEQMQRENGVRTTKACSPTGRITRTDPFVSNVALKEREVGDEGGAGRRVWEGDGAHVTRAGHDQFIRLPHLPLHPFPYPFPPAAPSLALTGSACNKP